MEGLSQRDQSQLREAAEVVSFGGFREDKADLRAGCSSDGESKQFGRRSRSVDIDFGECGGVSLDRLAHSTFATVQLHSPFDFETTWRSVA